MAEELEVLWQKLKVTEEEEVSISLGDECTRAANARGKNCLVMRVLSRRGIMVEALRKNIRMLWKPNKSLQISAIGEELFLAEFEDERDKKRVMDMRSWHYEKQLVLLQEFDGEQDPKDIVLKWSPFWVQIYNLPLKSRTKETGEAIGASLGKVMDIDVAETGVSWGRCLRVRVEVDITRELIRGRKINIEKGEVRWVHFKYERLPNFCYRCGLLDHDLKECPESVDNDEVIGKGELQYGAWLRGDPVRRFGGEYSSANKKGGDDPRKATKAGMEGRQTDRVEPRGVVARDKQLIAAPAPEGDTMGQQTERMEGEKLLAEVNHENGKFINLGENPKETLAQLGKEKREREVKSGGIGGSTQKVTKTQHEGIPKFDFEPASNALISESQVGLDVEENEGGPVAMTYEAEVGWVAEKLGPCSGHWKRRARVGPGPSKGNVIKVELDTSQRKRERSTPLKESDLNTRETKRKKNVAQGSESAEKEIRKDGGVAVAARQHPPSLMTVLAWNCRGMGSTPAVRALTDEVKGSDPCLVFLAETKSNQNRIKGLQRKLGLTQGITVPSDGRSGGLAMMWKEGCDVRLKSCSNTHIDVVVCDGNGVQPWRATGFYGHPDSGLRSISWNLLESLKRQCNMPWIVFGDFNEILNSDEKLGWLDRDARQMKGFRECLEKCGLIDLGFVGQRFTWCNGRIGEQRTLVRLDRMVANEEWLNLFPEAKVFHRSMAASDHCLLSLSLRRRGPKRVFKKRFMFEEMWTRDEGCKTVIEMAWDPLNCSPEVPIQKRLKSCQDHLQVWNRSVFGNVNRVLKQKQRQLQQLEALNLLHESAEEIQGLKKENK